MVFSATISTGLDQPQEIDRWYHGERFALEAAVVMLVKHLTRLLNNQPT